MTIRNIPLDQLHFGADANPPINVRKTGRDSDIAGLAASILAHGLGQALNVREMDGAIYVVDGDRRLAALRLNAEAGKIAADQPIKCDFDGSNGDGAELSLALNIERIGMHEADIYEAFHGLAERGLSATEIASRFGEDPRRVERMLALGKLHPKILDAWRQDELGNNAGRTVQAFTLAASLDEQEQVYDRLAANGHLSAHWIHEALGVGEQEAKQMLNFVGADAFVKAGGVLIEDLFGDNDRISDIGLLKNLAAARMKEEIDALLDQGWSWVARSADLPANWRYNWERIRVEPEFYKSEAAEIKKLRKIIKDADYWEYNEEQKAAAARIAVLEGIATLRAYEDSQKQMSGVAITLDQSGKLDITPGLVRPEAKKAAKKADSDKLDSNGAPARLSNAVMSRLSVQLTMACQRAVSRDPHVALAAVLAGMTSKGYYDTSSPVRIAANGLSARGRPDRPSFAASFEEYRGLSTDALLETLANIVGATFDLSVQTADTPPLSIEANAALVSALPAAINDELREAFDAESYFGGIPAASICSAIAEAINADEARKAGTLKKKDLVAFAVANLPQTGWLPAELRTIHYVGPGARATARESA